MASQDFVAGSVPTDIVAGLSLTQGTRYTAQNLSQGGTLFVRQAATAPAATGAGHRIEPGGDFVIAPAGQAIWLWSDGTADIPVIVTEAA